MEIVNKKDLMTAIEKRIDKEQHQDVRVKELTPGLLEALQIINQYIEYLPSKYQYQHDGSWQDVMNNKNLPILLDMGFNIRRKKDV